MAIETEVVFALLCALLFGAQHVVALKEVVGILDSATDLRREEIDALRPLFGELQLQYDYIVGETKQDSGQLDAETQALYASTRFTIEEPFQGLLQLQKTPSRIAYNSSLPSVGELVGCLRSETMTDEQRLQVEDVESLLQETLEEAQSQIDAIVGGAMQMEVDLLKINKPKLAKYIYKALSALFEVSVRVRRAAYCTYSHTPQLNESLRSVYDGVDCYNYSTALVLRIQRETVRAVITIRANIFDLAAVYKKAAAKNSLLGKIATLILNLTKIARDIRETYAIATHAADALRNDMPDAAKRSLKCGSEFAATIPQIVATVANLTTCITFVDDTTPDYDFMRPEAERDFN